MNNADGSSWPYAGVDGAAAAAWNDVQRNGNMVSSIRTFQGLAKGGIRGPILISRF